MGLFDFLKKKEFEDIKQLKLQLEKYKPIVDIEAEVESQKKNLEQIISSKNTDIKNIETAFNALNSNYQSALETYKNLRKEVSIFESKLDLIEFGIYEPVYNFEKSDDYREEQNKIIQIQKEMGSCWNRAEVVILGQKDMDFALWNLLDENLCYGWLLDHFHNGNLCCPRCGGANYRKHHARRAPVLQYCCRDCGCFFNILTGTSFQKSHYPCSKIVLILRGITKGDSTAGLSRELEVDRSNLLYLRHELQSNAMFNREKSPLPDKETESDEMYQNAGEKGLLHPDVEDPPRRRANKRRGAGNWDNDRPGVMGTVGRSSGQVRLEVLNHTCKQEVQENLGG